jgi:hypothetical protein
MAVHGTILARQLRLRGGANAFCNDTNWSSANHTSANHTSANYTSAIRVNTNATRVIPPPACILSASITVPLPAQS